MEGSVGVIHLYVMVFVGNLLV